VHLEHLLQDGRGAGGDEATHVVGPAGRAIHRQGRRWPAEIAVAQRVVGKRQVADVIDVEVADPDGVQVRDVGNP
jgi:hypothetical protein